MKGKEHVVKFRCERDVLADALGTASTGSRRSGCRAAGAVRASASSSSGTSLQLTGTDLELTIQVTK